jgi:signal peptidase II
VVPVLLIFSAVLLLDQATKYLAQAQLAHVSTWPVIPGIFHLTLVHNQGAAFGMLPGGVFIFSAVSVVCVFFILLMLRNPPLMERTLGVSVDRVAVRCSLGLIMGGAVGNLIDRVCLGYVVDFLDARVWPVFNVADSAITVGGVVLFFVLWQNDRKKVSS